MEQSEFEKVKVLLDKGLYEEAIRCIDETYIQNFIQSDSIDTLHSQLDELYAKLDKIDIVQHISGLISNNETIAWPSSLIWYFESTLHSMYTEALQSEDIFVSGITLSLMLRLSYQFETQHLFREYLNESDHIFIKNNSQHEYLALLDEFLSIGSKEEINQYGLYFSKARALFSIAKYAEAIQCYELACQIALQLDEYARYATCLESIGVTYGVLGNYNLQLHYHLLVKGIREEHNLLSLIGNSYVNIGLCYMNLGEKAKSVEYYKKGLEYQQQHKKDLDIAIAKLLLSKVTENVQERISLLKESSEYFNSVQDIGRLADATIDLAISHIEIQEYELGSEYLVKAEYLVHQIDYEPLIGTLNKEYAVLYLNEKSPFYDYQLAEDHILKAIEIFSSLRIKDFHYQSLCIYSDLLEKQCRWEEYAKVYKHYHMLEKEVMTAEAQSKMFSFELLQSKERESNFRKLQQTKYREQEKLLYTMLPAQIAKRIVSGEQIIAELSFSVSVFFMDIINFTQISGNLTPSVLLEGLNTIFIDIDHLASECMVEKIKTIGDAYMAVSGIPEEDPDHAIKMVNFALKVMEKRNDWKLGDENVSVRIGIHTGPVIGGVIGKQRISYDVWGDTVNVASRLESYGEPNKIQISKDFAEKIKHISTITCIPRGEVQLKGLGKIDAFWLEKR